MAKKVYRNELFNEQAIRNARDAFNSLFNLLPDPDTILSKSGKSYNTYRELLNDSHVYSVVEQRTAGTKSLLWQLNQNEADDRVHEVTQSALEAIDVYQLIRQILNAVLFGFVPIEIVWRMGDGIILPARLSEKPQEWFGFNKEGQLVYLPQGASGAGEEIVDYKFLLVQNNPTYANPYGEKALSRCFWPVTFKRGGMKFWVQFMERYGTPWLIGKQPRTAGKDATDDLLSQLEMMFQDAIAVLPDDSSVSIIEAGKTGSVDAFERFNYFLNSEISKAILTQTLTTEVQDKATHAAAGTMGDMLSLVQMGDKRLVEQAVNQLIRYIVELNFGEGTPQPRFELYSEQEVDKLIAERDQILVATGVRFTKDYYKRTYNLQDEDFEITQTQQPMGVAFAQDDRSSLPAQPPNADDKTYTPADDELIKQSEQLLQPIFDMINNAAGYDEMMAQLNELFPILNTTQLEELLAKLIFIAEIEGRADAQ